MDISSFFAFSHECRTVSSENDAQNSLPSFRTKSPAQSYVDDSHTITRREEDLRNPAFSYAVDCTVLVCLGAYLRTYCFCSFPSSCTGGPLARTKSSGSPAPAREGHATPHSPIRPHPVDRIQYFPPPRPMRGDLISVLPPVK